MHRVVAIALPEVVAFDLSIPAQIFGHVSERHRYTFTVCAEHPGLIDTTTGFAIRADAPLDAVRRADTVIVPGFMPLDDPGAAIGAALREAAQPGRAHCFGVHRCVRARRGRVTRRAPGNNPLGACR